MKIFKKTGANAQPAKTQPAIRGLSQIELLAVSGGINPQPLPPCHPPEQRLK